MTEGNTTQTKETKEEKKVSKVKETASELKKKDEITLEDLLSSGVHFGHEKSKWNPKMRSYILTTRNGVRIINLNKTKEQLKQAAAFIEEKSMDGQILFVATKRQAKQIIEEAAELVGMPYVTERWLGGTLTNFKTLRARIEKLMMVEALQEKGELKKYTKKEQAKFKEKLEKFNKRMGGIKIMKDLPKAVFVVDLIDDKIAVLEAQKLNIPVVAIADTNVDPNMANLIIPGNDDAVKSINFIVSYIVARLL